MKILRKNRGGSKITRFQLHVYEATKKIPRGRVTTYKILTDYISAKGRRGSCRAVGQALRRNPFAPKVPCHRVIASDLSAGGFKGGSTVALIRRKLNLLGKEGVKFINGRLVNPTLIYRFK
ncbi:MGMT family protein [Verrucomicrobiota bacterium]